MGVRRAIFQILLFRRAIFQILPFRRARPSKDGRLPNTAPQITKTAPDDAPDMTWSV